MALLRSSILRPPGVSDHGQRRRHGPPPGPRRRRRRPGEGGLGQATSTPMSGMRAASPSSFCDIRNASLPSENQLPYASSTSSIATSRRIYQDVTPATEVIDNFAGRRHRGAVRAANIDPAPEPTLRAIRRHEQCAISVIRSNAQLSVNFGWSLRIGIGIHAARLSLVPSVPAHDAAHRDRRRGQLRQPDRIGQQRRAPVRHLRRGAGRGQGSGGSRQGPRADAQEARPWNHRLYGKGVRTPAAAGTNVCCRAPRCAAAKLTTGPWDWRFLVYAVSGSRSWRWGRRCSVPWMHSHLPLSRTNPGGLAPAGPPVLAKSHVGRLRPVVR